MLLIANRKYYRWILKRWSQLLVQLRFKENQRRFSDYGALPNHAIAQLFHRTTWASKANVVVRQFFELNKCLLRQAVVARELGNQFGCTVIVGPDWAGLAAAVFACWYVAQLKNLRTAA